MANMAALRFVLGDQLSMDLSALRDAERERDVVLMCEVMAEASYAPHHVQKLAFVFSAMRHHRDALKTAGFTVDYVALDDPDNTGALGGELRRAVARHRPERIVATEPGEWRVLEEMRGWSAAGLPLEIRADDRFLCSLGEFNAWASERKSLRMEFFYREMRRKTGYLMQDGEPEGGQWNFDHDNREALPKGVAPPARAPMAPDAITVQAIEMVRRRFPRNFGRLEPFDWPVTRAQALARLKDFVDRALPDFGRYQDAMKTGEPFLFHSLLSGALNIGLLDPREICEAALKAWRGGRAPINAVEGFIRQIIGWREYVRGIYWLKMPGYATANALDATRPLPAFYWTAETDMACMREAIESTRDHAYAHHIQRLMITGNFALLAGIAPAQVQEWYLAVYVDAYEWVELPNVSGMALFADGGLLASKPYAASGAYIDRMSDHCGACAYKVKLKAGPKACPFNVLYWHFLMVNRKALAKNQRLAMPYRNLANMTQQRRDEIAADAQRFLDGLRPWA